MVAQALAPTESKSANLILSRRDMRGSVLHRFYAPRGNDEATPMLERLLAATRTQGVLLQEQSPDKHVGFFVEVLGLPLSNVEL